jgi:hypothetical protein
VDFAASEEAGHGLEGDGSEDVFFVQVFQDFEMERTMMPGIAFGQIDGDLNRHTLQRHPMPAAILQPAGKRGASQDGGETERIAGHYVDAGQEPLSLLHEREAFKGVAGESCVRATKADGDQQAPARVEQRAFGREDEKESEDEAAGDVDQQRAVGEREREIAGDESAEEVAGARSDNGAERDPEIVCEIVGDKVCVICHDGVLLQKFCRSYQPEGRLMANSIASASV